MTDRELPSWAVRLRQERVRRLWSQKITAVHLRDAADEQTRAVLPPLDNIQRYVRAYEAGQHALVADDARSLTAWLTATNVSDDAADDLSRAVSALSEAHSGRPPERLMGDLHRNAAAAAYGATAQLCAREADSTQAIALSVRAKTARWRMQYAASAELAEAATEVISPDSGVSAWSCSRPRQSLFAMSVAIRFHNSSAALGAAQLADTAGASGVPRVTGTWAQIRLGAGIARIIADDLHGALAEIAPVINLAPEYRMATITAYTRQIEKRLQRRRFLRDSTAGAIRSRVHEFNAKALTRSGRGSA